MKPSLTLQRLLPCLAATSFAASVAARWSLPALLDLLLAPFVLVIAGTLVDEGIESLTDGGGMHAREVNGWFTSRIHLGRCMGRAVLTAAAAASVPGRRWTAIVVGALSAALLIAADSRAAALVAPTCLLGFLGMCLVQRFRRWAAALLVATITGGLLITFGVVRHAD